MHLIRLFKVACHLCKELVISDAHIDGEAKLITNAVFDCMCQSNRIWVDTVCTAHIQIAPLNEKVKVR